MLSKYCTLHACNLYGYIIVYVLCSIYIVDSSTGRVEYRYDIYYTIYIVDPIGQRINEGN